jgi:hypothetical protein
MAGTPNVIKGVVRGKTIELDNAPEFPDGQRVSVTIEPTPEPGVLLESPLDALKRAAGTWADDPEGLKRFLEWNRQRRKVDRRALPK